MAYANGKAPVTLFIEGNIGVGKSTFLGILTRFLAIQPVYEPHEKWQTVAGTENLLDLFYKDMPRWAYTFQTYAFISRIRTQIEHAQHNADQMHIVERSVYSDRYCFAKNCFEAGLMGKAEWKLYQEWSSWLVSAHTTRPHGFIYLRTKPDTCYQRLQKRARSEEATVPLSYLQQLHEKHEQWLIEKKDVSSTVRDVPVLVLNCNKDFKHDIDEQQQQVRRVADFFSIAFNNVPSNTRQPSLSL